MMESVEDIPSSALRAGIDWSWETFPEYLDALDRIAARDGRRDPGPARRRSAGYVMGERGAANEPATADDIAAMADIVRDGIARRRARLLDVAHRSSTTPDPTAPRSPAPTPARTSCSRSATRSATSDAGLFEVVPSGVARRAPRRPCPASSTGCSGWPRASSARCACWSPRTTRRPDDWRAVLDTAARGAGRRCAAVRADRAVAPAAPLFGLDTTYHPLDRCPSFAALAGLTRRREGGAAARPLGASRDRGRGPAHADPIGLPRPAGTACSRSPIRSTTSRPTSSRSPGLAERAGTTPVEY